MPIKLRNSSWKDVSSIKLRVSGAWKNVSSAYIRVSGTWKQIFSSVVSPSVESQSEISVSAANATTGLRYLTGTHYHWSNYDTLDYAFQMSTDGSSYNSFYSDATATNPAAGLTTSNTQSLLNNGTHVVANTTNYYRYYTKGYNSTYGTTTYSYSTAVTVEGARNISNLATSGATTTSINLSWTAGAYSNSYIVYYGGASGILNNNVHTSSTSITISGLSPSTTYYFAVKPYTGSIVSGSVTGYAGNLSSEVSATTSAPPTLSSVTGFQVYNYNPTTGYIEVKWNAVANATDYFVSYYIGSTFIQSAYTAGMLTWSPVAYLSENTTYTFYVYPLANGYLSPSATSLNYTTPYYPAYPTNFSWSVTTTSITFDSFTGGTNPKIVELYKYQTLFSAPTYQTVTVSSSSSITFSGLSPGAAYTAVVYGGSYGIVNGVSTLFASSSNIVPYGRYITTNATAVPTSGTNTSFTAGGVGTTAIGYTRVPASIPSQVPWFALILFKWNGSFYAFQAARFHRIDGSSLDDDNAHNTGYGSLSNMNGFFLGLTSGYYLVESRVWNTQGYDTTNSGAIYITL